MPVNILLVDDNKVFGDSIREILKPRGYIIVEATNAENALSMLASQRFDLILLDITLPEKSGFQVLEYLKDKNVSSSVIVVTGTVALENAIKKATMNEWDFVTKPYNPTYLLKFIDHVLTGEANTNHKLQIITAGDFIKSTPTGELDMIASKEGFVQIAAAGAHLEGYTVLIDLREISSRLSTSNIYQLASELVKYDDTFRRKTAILTNPNQDLAQAQFFETVSQNRGFNVKAFTLFEEAIIWLSESTRLTEYPIV
jgi:DNA-binding response OmpR family regulator